MKKQEVIKILDDILEAITYDYECHDYITELEARNTHARIITYEYKDKLTKHSSSNK